MSRLYKMPPKRNNEAHNAFSSLRNQGVIRKHLLYQLMAYAVPDWWNNVRAVKEIHLPLLHSESNGIVVNMLAG